MVPTNARMGSATLRVSEEIDHVERLMHLALSNLYDLSRHTHQAARLAHIKEHLSEAQARLEGLHAFVVECQKSVDRTSAPTVEEFDVWV